jgi:dynein light intermediate chain
MEQTALQVNVPETLLKYEQPEIIENLNATRKKKIAPPPETKPQQELIDFLDSLLPPRRFTQGPLEFRQRVSLTPTSRSDVIKLEEQLDEMLKTKRARDKGICPIRSELFEDCMNEMIREIALEQRDRGLVLRDIRDELNSSIKAYNSLYESAVTHGIRKAIYGEQNKNELKAANDALEAEIKQFHDKIAELEAKMEEAEKSDAADFAAKEKDHAEKVATLRAENLALRQKLESLLAPVTVTQ